MCYRLDLDLKFFTGTAFWLQIFYRNGIPDRYGLLSPPHYASMRYYLVVSNKTNGDKFYVIYLLASRMQYEDICKLLFTVFPPSQNDNTVRSS